MGGPELPQLRGRILNAVPMDKPIIGKLPIEVPEPCASCGKNRDALVPVRNGRHRSLSNVSAHSERIALRFLAICIVWPVHTIAS